jgi:translocator assembly and maintenance protein 41
MPAPAPGTPHAAPSPASAYAASGALRNLVLERFPAVQFACGYGSGVIPQASGSAPGHGERRAAPPGIDLIFAVDSSADFHEANLARNPADYAWLPRTLFTPSMIVWCQHSLGARVWYNPSVPVGERVIKYGVISTQDLLVDLLDWETFYLAGRLQKPVQSLMPPPSAVGAALHVNRERALRAALLLLPQPAAAAPESATRLFESLVSLSYTGDVRMGLAESPTKVRDIVAGAGERFERLYLDGAFKHLVTRGPTPGTFVRHVHSPQALAHGLPAKFQHCTDPEALRRRLASTIRVPSLTQSAKGVLTGGVAKALGYLGSKIRKRLR